MRATRPRGPPQRAALAHAQAVLRGIAADLGPAPAGGCPIRRRGPLNGYVDVVRVLPARLREGFPLPKMLCISGFPSPSWPEAKRPWSKNAPMADPAFQDEARGWNVNEIVFQPANWKTFAPMMRDDFACFDEYVYTPPPAHLKKGEFPFPITARYFKDDKRCKKEHLSSWIDLTSEKASFSCTEFEGNHLFFYQVPERAKYMEDVVAKLPAEFKAVEIS